jgi:S1-C subfamily serine protease
VVAAVAFGAGPELAGASSVVRLHAVAADGKAQFGSGVVIGPDEVATACHVTRNAVTIEISQGSKRWIAQQQVGSAFRDLCIVHVAIDGVPIANIRASHTLQQSERVVAVGFEGGRTELVAKAGVVAALYPYDGGSVVRTSTQFEFGSSGGGLFDEAGNLVGVLSFKARTGESLHFALPSEWLSRDGPLGAAFVSMASGAVVSAFWERSHSDRPAFLGLAMSEAARQRN